MRRAAVIFCVFAAVVGAPALGFGQWLRYPTEGIPRKPDGKPDLTAAAPRLPDSHPDLSSIWHAAQPRQCVNGAGQAVPCGLEIGGSPPCGEPGRKMAGGHPPQ